VHGEVDPAGDQRTVDLLGEVALAAQQGEVTGPQVGGGLDLHDLDRQAGRDLVQLCDHALRLCLSERIGASFGTDGQ
jgi:hypothetical protein